MQEDGGKGELAEMYYIAFSPLDISIDVKTGETPNTKTDICPVLKRPYPVAVSASVT